MWAGSLGLERPGLQRPPGVCRMERSPLSLEDAKGGKDRDRGFDPSSLSYSLCLITCNTYFPPVFHVSSQIFFLKYHAL